MKDTSTALRHSLALAIRRLRKLRNLSQEDFGLVSSRTYISVIERELTSPTLEKLDEIAGVMKIHPAALVLVTYAFQDERAQGDVTIDEIALSAKMLLSNILEG